MIKITGINHIGIAAPSQLAEMRRFYVEVLGIASVPRAIPKELEETIPGFWLDFPVTHTQIHILESDEQAPSREHKPISIGPHTAYTVESVEDAARHLEALDVPFQRFGPVIVVVVRAAHGGTARGRPCHEGHAGGRRIGATPRGRDIQF